MDELMLQPLFRVQHRHTDGSWAGMTPREHHDSAAHDPEREWAMGRIYRCASCEEEVRVELETDGTLKGRP